MNKLAFVAVAAAAACLPACTTVHKNRRTMTEWSMSGLKESADPCGSMPKESGAAYKGTKCQDADPTIAGRSAVDALTVKPIQFAMLPISWALDTVLLNPINAWKKAELETYERKYCKTSDDPNCTDAHAAHHAYGVVPTATPWPISYVLTAPEFAARWVWHSVTPSDPVNEKAYDAYWREHNETTGN